MSNDRVCPDVDARERLAAVIARGRERIAQQTIDAIPRRERLRTADFAHHAAVDVGRAAELDRHAEVDWGIDADRTENVPQLGLRPDPRAPPGEFILQPLANMTRPAVA